MIVLHAAASAAARDCALPGIEPIHDPLAQASCYGQPACTAHDWLVDDCVLAHCLLRAACYQKHVQTACCVPDMSACPVSLGAGCLPGYASPRRYSIGIGAPILLSLLRIIQGLAMGGEFSVAQVYVSELAPVNRRGVCTGLLWTWTNLGMISATVYVRVLEAVLSPGEPRTAAGIIASPAKPLLHVDW